MYLNKEFLLKIKLWYKLDNILIYTKIGEKDMNKILIVEDELVISDLIKIELELKGYKCDTAKDGEIASDYIETRRYDLILLDIMIPREYVSGIYENGDILSISEKIISICQNRIVKRQDIKISNWAKILSRFACQKNRGGYGVGMAINMQYAIDKVRTF